MNEFKKNSMLSNIFLVLVESGGGEEKSFIYSTVIF